MTTLSKPLRGMLEKTVKEARERAEAGAKAALESLAVPHREPFAHLPPEERELRNRLRAHGRHLGDHRHPKTGEHDIHHLVAECAYEHWHRMLFARFLAENHLLMHPEGVAVTLEECAELAPEEGAGDAWELAGRYAARMLPQIFRPDHPGLQLTLAPEHQQELERLLSALPPEVFTASDSLGWVYQFWQSQRKEEINKSEVKIGADELPAVTQLFTEPYMVQFLLNNTLGAWWTGRHPGEPLPVEMPYLRLLEDGAPAAGTFEGWPQTAQELKILDPCCGSGHFLVATFQIMAAFRMVEEGLTPAAAGDAVLRENLFGLEIDERCTQIAAFALALAAWTFTGAEGHRELPPLNIACSGIPISAKRDQWVALAGSDERLRQGMDRLYTLFQNAPTLGSLINPAIYYGNTPLMEASFAELRPFLDKALAAEGGAEDHEKRELGVAAQEIYTAANFLSKKFNFVCTNVPYLTEKRQDHILKKFLNSFYTDSKADLATAFMKRCVDLLFEYGTVAVVVPQNWLFLTSYKEYRRNLLKEMAFNFLLHIGEGGFESPQAAGAFIILIIMTKAKPSSKHVIYGINTVDRKNKFNKVNTILTRMISNVNQQDILNNPDYRFSFEKQSDANLLSDYAISMRGIVSGDSDKWIRTYWEVDFSSIRTRWLYLQSTPLSTILYAGREHIIDWSTEGRGMLRPGTQNEAYGEKGVALCQMRSLPSTLYDGDLYDNNTGVIVPKDGSMRSAIWAFCSSPEFVREVRRIDPKLNVTNATLVKVPFDIERWQKVAEEMGPLPEPYSNDPTQWIFHGHPARSEQPLQVAVARLLGYRWPAELDDTMGLSDVARTLVKKSEALLAFTVDDGIVCLPPVRGKRPAAERLLKVLAAAYGPEWSAVRLTELMAAMGYAGKNLEAWLRDGFFKEHCQLFHHRPFIWHIWDGRKDGFAALVNYHKLDRKNLEALTYTYLGDWLQRQQDGVKRQEAGAEERLAAAQALQEKLQLILAGEAPYDIFIRWKPLEQQPLGWEPDLNDGVRLNIRPFMTANILRQPPKLNWNKDRGKDVASAPWYHLGPQYGGHEGDRINDHHLSLAEKLQALTNSGKA